jgi:hypothetical protein
MFAQSENIAALSASLAKAQGQIEGAVKGKENPHFKSKYADLSAVWEACRDALTANGLAVIQSPGPIAEGRLEMTTMLVHSSGEWIRGALTIPLGKVDAQAYGSAVTYARRYALAAFVGVSSADDDGNAAAKAAPKANGNDPWITDDQAAELVALMDEVGADRERFLNHLRIDTLSRLPASRFADAVKALEMKRKVAA